MKSNVELKPELCFSVGKSNIRTMAYIPVSNTFAIADGANVNVYSARTGSRTRVFQKHENEVLGIVHLCGDTVVSMDIGGFVFTWKVEDDANSILEEVRCIVPGEGLATLMKLNSSKILVSIFEDRLFLLSHGRGRNLSTLDHVLYGSNWVDYRMNVNNNEDGCGSWFVTEVSPGRFAIWNKERMGKVGEFRDNRPVYSGAVSNRYIVMDNGDKLLVRKNAPGYPEIPSINLEDYATETNGRLPTVEKLSFITASLVVMTTQRDGIYFTDLSANERVAHIHNIDVSQVIETVNTILMGDGRLCVIGESREAEEYIASITILHPPSQVREHVTKRALEMYREDVVSDAVPYSSSKAMEKKKEVVYLGSELMAVKDELAMNKAENAARYATQENELKVLKAQVQAVTSAQHNESRVHNMQMDRLNRMLAAQKAETELLKSQLHQLLNTSPEEPSLNKKRKL